MTDPFFDTDIVAARLLEQYKRHGNLIVAFDFDDTIFDYTGKGYKYDKVIELLKECKELGFYLILFTCREGYWLDNAIEYCDSLGISPDEINENTMQASRKPLFNILLDDRAGLACAYTALVKVVKMIKETK